MRQRINKLVVHCSDSPHRGDTAADIHQWHLARGWSGIGYHYVIREDGTVDRGRPEYWIGSHVAGHNMNSLGICMLGKEEFTKAQYTALEQILRSLLVKYPGAEILGHRDLDPKKTCPNFDVRGWWEGVTGKAQ